MGEPLLSCVTNYTAMFGQLLEEGLFVDCTLAAEGRYLKAHKAVLSAASVYFELLFTQERDEDPVIIFTNIRYMELEAVMKFIYQGEVELFEDGLGEFLNAATFLQIGGLDHNKLIVKQRNAPTRSSIQEASSVYEKVEGEDFIYDDFGDRHITPRYMSWEESSLIMPANDYGCTASSNPPCDENLCKSELPESNCSFSCSTVQPAFGEEFSTLVTDIEIKEPDEEICSEVNMDTDDTTARMEYMNGDSDKEVSPGQHDTKLQFEDVQSKSAAKNIGSGEEHFKCPTCDFESSQGPDVNVHMCHIVNNPFELSRSSLSSTQSSVANNDELKHVKGKPFKCSQCSYACSRKNHLTIHMRKHTGERPFKCTRCTYASSQKHELLQHVRTHTGEKPFKCSQCTYACSLKHNLTKHMRTHTGEKPFKCSQCTYACSEKSSIITHMRTHTGEKPFKCSQCTYACSLKHNLTKHIRTHTGEKPFKCSQCTYACSQEQNLTKHLRTHTGEKPFKCSQCTYACSEKSSIITHMRTHTGEKPFKCSQCTYECSLKNNLITHMRTHTGEKPFKCSQCTYECSLKNHLITHMRTHTGEKPFKCAQCTYACSVKHALIQHMRKHTGEKPFTCSHCTYSCSWKHHLIKHMRTHTGEKPL